MGQEGRKAEGIDRQRERYNLLLERYAEALGENQETIRSWWRNNTDFLRMRLNQAGIDPSTGLPFNAEASHEPATASDGIVTTTEPIDHDKPAGRMLGARDEGEWNFAAEDIHRGLQQLGIPSPTTPAMSADGDAFERDDNTVVNGLAAGA